VARPQPHGAVLIYLTHDCASAGKDEGCRTRFSNTNFRLTWVIKDENVLSMLGDDDIEGEKTNNNIYVRCVKDTTPD